MRIYTTQNDIRYLLVEHEEVISDIIRRDGVWGKDYLNLSSSILRNSKPGRVIDVGAGIGTFTIPLAIEFDTKHVFDAIEPLSKINMQLSANILLNNLDNVDAHKYVISDTNQIVEFFSLDFECSGNHGAFSFNTKFDSMRSIEHNGKKEIYEFKKLDDFNFKDVRLIKVTTPAMEFKVFMGMYETLVQNDWPPVVFESWNLDWYKEERAKAMDFFAARGYEHYEIIDDHVLAFKTKDQADHLLSGNLSSAQKQKEYSGGFNISEQEHDREHVLKTQVGANDL